MRHLSRILVGLTAVVLIGPPVSAGELADLHRKTVKPKPVDSAPLQERFERLDKPTHGVTEIGLERTVCFGVCPAYTVVLKSDGTVRYTGEKYVTRKGTHQGRISEWDYNRLAELLLELGYADFANDYEIPVSDMSTTYTMAVINGRRKVIRNYGDTGPLKLWAIQQAIDAVLHEAEWDGEPSRHERFRQEQEP